MFSSNNLKRGTVPDKSFVEVTKFDLVGEVIVYEVTDYQPEAETKHGKGPQADMDLLIVTGPKAGTSVKSWRAWGLLASQAARDGQDGPVVGKVVAGPDRGGRPSWYGIDTAVSEAEFAKAEAAIAGAASDAKPF